MGLILGQGTKIPQALEQLNHVPQLLSPRVTTREKQQGAWTLQLRPNTAE